MHRNGQTVGFCKVEIYVLDIEECNTGPANRGQATKRIFLLDNGIHYDSVIFGGFRADEVRQVVVDEMRLWEPAVQMSKVVHACGGSKSDRTLVMKSDVCGKMVKGKRRQRHTGRSGVRGATHVMLGQVRSKSANKPGKAI
jgi:hypothetical protein